MPLVADLLRSGTALQAGKEVDRILALPRARIDDTMPGGFPCAYCVLSRPLPSFY
jgi:hypothetical protein